jgi:hypothetical protein
MQELIKVGIGIFILFLGIPIGDYLAKLTKEELSSGKRWFNLIIIFCLLGAVAALILREDSLLFTLMFIAIITSRSLKKGKNKNKK